MFSKDFVLGTNCFFLTRNVPFSKKIPLNRSKKWFGVKNGCHPSIIGHSTPKHSRSSMQQLKIHFGVNSPLFQLKRSVLFIWNVINQLWNIWRGKIEGVPYQKMGTWPLRPPKPHFHQKSCKEDFCLARFYQRKMLGVSKSHV